MPFTRAIVEDSGDAIAFDLGERVEAGSLFEILPDQAVGVLVGAPLP